MTQVCDKVFVYGTLRKGFPLHEHLAASRPRLLGPGVIRGRLYDLGEYPGAFPSLSARDEIHGEVYELADVSNQLRRLDEVEEFHPQSPGESLFLRRTEQVKLENGRRVEAWVYFLPSEPADAPVIPGGDYSKRTSVRKPLSDR